jgi:hypothetical protein
MDKYHLTPLIQNCCLLSALLVENLLISEKINCQEVLWVRLDLKEQ